MSSAENSEEPSLCGEVDYVAVSDCQTSEYLVLAFS